jgi:hypothetical protein
MVRQKPWKLLRLSCRYEMFEGEHGSGKGYIQLRSLVLVGWYTGQKWNIPIAPGYTYTYTVLALGIYLPSLRRFGRHGSLS